MVRVAPEQLDIEAVESAPTASRSAGSPGSGRTATKQAGGLPRLSVSPGEAAVMLGVSRDYFDEHVIGDLRIVRRGRRILVALSELERWLDRNAAPGSIAHRAL